MDSSLYDGSVTVVGTMLCDAVSIRKGRRTNREQVYLEKGLFRTVYRLAISSTSIVIIMCFTFCDAVVSSTRLRSLKPAKQHCSTMLYYDV